LITNECVVQTQSGKLKGAYQDSLYIFKGVPYAAPPTGGFRWFPPQPVKSWNGIRDAQDFAPVAPQLTGGQNFMPEFNAEEPRSEDCLYLNIWSPGLDSIRRPVMVWIHGGAFSRGSGSSPQYHGNTLAKRGNTVIVTINYRLGCLGFLHLDKVTRGKIPATGNEGLLDQIAALKWVRGNIAGFGGDPDNVTIFGESAGAMSIGCLLAMPQAHGLFNKAILQSGSNTFKPLNEAIHLTEQFLGLLGLKGDDVEYLRAMPVEKLITAQQELSTKLKIAGSVMEPVMDGKILPEFPIEAVKHGSAGKTAIMVGSNLEESRFMARMNPNLTKVDDAGLVRRWQQVFPPELVPALVDDCRNAMTKGGKTVSPSELALALQTDAQFRIPAIRLVEAQRSNNQAAYSYLFDWISPAPGMGACHALDVGFVFGNLSATFNGTGPKVEKLAKNMQDAWLAFARTGNPGCEGLGKWPLYGRRRETMILGENCHLAAAPFDEERAAWDAIPDKYLG
jgi:para-nitrobenzyl esterase